MTDVTFGFCVTGQPFHS